MEPRLRGSASLPPALRYCADYTWHFLYRYFYFPFSARTSAYVPGKSAFLNLPYATYGPAYYNSSGRFYIFRNVRFAAPPLGELRWASPAEPQNETGVQDGTYGPSCFQEATSSTAQSEDCLFLDVYVPGYAVQDPSAYQLPVLFFLYGGGYCFPVFVLR